MTHAHQQSAPTRGQDELRTLNGIDGRLRAFAATLGASSVQYPVLIARDILETAEYPQAFPHLLMSARHAHVTDNDAALEVGDLHPKADGPWCLSPAVCYHTYAQLSGQVLDTPAIITARGRCFRAELESAPGVRQIEFEMREIVLLGPLEWVDASTEVTRAAVEELARDVALSGQWQAAEDPFFLPMASGKALMQRLLKVKIEYQWPGPGGLALASVNRHGTFFGQRFGIRTPDGQPVHTACIAIGLDRWAHHAQGSTVGFHSEDTQ